MKKQYAYLSQEDLDKFTLALIKYNTNQQYAFDISLESTSKLRCEDSAQSKFIIDHQAFNGKEISSVGVETESTLFHAIMGQKEKKICFSTLDESIERMSTGGDSFICGSFKMGLDDRQPPINFIRLDEDYIPCTYNGKYALTSIVMWMCASKMMISAHELMSHIRDTPLDIWGKIYKFNNDPKPPTFTVKPFVVGFNWISSLNLQMNQVEESNYLSKAEMEEMGIYELSSFKSEVPGVKKFLKDIKDLEEEYGKLAPINVFIDRIRNYYGTSEEEVEEIIKKLKYIGEIFEPRRGFLKTVV